MWFLLLSLRSRSYETSPWSRSICHGLYHVISRHSTLLLPTNLMLSRSVAVCVMWLSSCHVPCHVFVFSLRSRSYEISPWSRSICNVLYLWLSSLCWSPTHKILSLSRPIQRHGCPPLCSRFNEMSLSTRHMTCVPVCHGPLRITSLLCHALVITWRHYTLASLSFLSLTMFLFAVTLIKSHDVTVILPHSISLCHSPTNNVTSPFADTWPKLIFTYCQVVVRIIVLYFIALMSSKGSSMLFVTKRYYFFISAPTC